ncbi:NAC domain-containing protein 1 [Cardamine amara subsp. amara]|uniref:NAC domain-containing protein 1 n=1 Tax=Cardamine amara subsp. amara TaxID=228776 RepID=A0ABD1BGF4_CARAN
MCVIIILVNLQADLKRETKKTSSFLPLGVARSAKGGFWHSNSATKKLTLGNIQVGEKQHLTFYSGKPPKEGKSNWLMIEYRLPKEKDSNQKKESMMAIVLSKIYAKSDPEEEEKTEEFADFVNQHQEYVTREEDVWQRLQSMNHRS